MGTRYTLPTDPQWWGHGMDLDTTQELAEIARDLLQAHCIRHVIFPVIDIVEDRAAWEGCPSGDPALIEALDRLVDPTSEERVFAIHDVIFALQLIEDQVKHVAKREKLGKKSIFSMAEVIRIWKYYRDCRDGV